MLVIGDLWNIATSGHAALGKGCVPCLIRGDTPFSELTFVVPLTTCGILKRNNCNFFFVVVLFCYVSLNFRFVFVSLSFSFQRERKGKVVNLKKEVKREKINK